jgi:TldD protein
VRRREFLAIAAALPPLVRGQAAPDDVVLRAMRDEIKRSMELRIGDAPAPYYIEFGIEDLDQFSVAALLGAVVTRNAGRSRIPRIQVRAGDYSFDNTNYIFSDLFGRTGGRLPTDDDYGIIRRSLWLATDSVYKGSVEALARKRAALKSVTQQEELADFAKADPVRIILPLARPNLDEGRWVDTVRSASALFTKFPKIFSSGVEFSAGRTNSYYVNSEGTECRHPDDLYSVRIRAASQCADGMPVRDAATIEARSLVAMPSAAEIEERALAVARNVTALVDAPAGESYSGPVLFEGISAPQLFAQLIGDNLGLTRRPVTEPGRTPPLPASELEGRMGSRILPEFFDVVDDPTQQTYRGRELLGYYPVDMEGVVPEPLMAIEKGAVKSFLLTRQPVRGFERSNGRARLPGLFGAKAAMYGNLFVKAHETMPEEELKKRLLTLIEQRDKPFGLLIRKLDYPTTATADELRQLSQASSQRGGSSRVVSPPLLVYQVYRDGREELVRGLRFRAINVRSLRDIIAASATEHFFDYLGAGRPLPGAGTAGYVSTHTVVAPSILFEDLELDKREEDWPKPAIVPPPELTT